MNRNYPEMFNDTVQHLMKYGLPITPNMFPGMSPKTVMPFIMSAYQSDKRIKRYIDSNPKSLAYVQAGQSKKIDGVLARENNRLEYENIAIKNELNALNSEFSTLSRKIEVLNDSLAQDV